MMDWHLSTAARTLWQEARGESLIGQQAVAHVIVNRLKLGKWGATLAEVCLSEFHGVHQFSGWNRTDPNRKTACLLRDDNPELLKLAALIQNALDGEADMTLGATHYHAKSIKAPIWVIGDPSRGVPAAVLVGQFGNQLFYRGVK